MSAETIVQSTTLTDIEDTFEKKLINDHQTLKSMYDDLQKDRDDLYTTVNNSADQNNYYMLKKERDELYSIYVKVKDFVENEHYSVSDNLTESINDIEECLDNMKLERDELKEKCEYSENKLYRINRTMNPSYYDDDY